jgi:hypothetical protein
VIATVRLAVAREERVAQRAVGELPARSEQRRYFTL